MKRLRGAGVAGIVALACSVFVPACSSDDAPASDIVLYPTTKILDADALGRLSDVSPDQTTMTFGSTNAAIDGIAVNDVVVGGVSAKTPYGAMRKVTAIAKTGAGTTLTTQPAALAEVIEKGTIPVPRTLLQPAGVKAKLEDGVTMKSRVLRPGELSPQDEYGGKVGEEFTLGFENYEVTKGVTLGASIGFGLGADVSLTVDKTQVTGKFAVSGSESITLDVNAKYADTFDKTKVLATYEFPPVVFNAGPLPVVLTFGVDVEVRLKGNTKARLAWSGTESANAEVGLSIGTNGVEPILNGKATGVDDPLQIEGLIDARGSLGLNVTASINTLPVNAALSAGGGGFLELKGDTSKEPCWNVTAGLYGTYGVKTEFLGIIPLLEKNGSQDFGTTELASGPCGLSGFGFKTWSNVVTPTGYDRAPSIALYPDNTFLVGSNGAATSGYLARYNPDGTPIWERQITGTFTLQDVMVGSDGMGWVGGGVGTTPGFARLGNDGAPTMAKKIVSQDLLAPPLFAASKTGGLLMGGRYDSDSMGWAAKTDANGAILWAKTYSGIAPNAIAEANDGGIVLFGTSSISGGAKTVIVRTDASGNVVFAKSYGEGRLFGGTALADNGFAASGSTATAEGVVLRTDANGVLVWGFSFENPTNAQLDYAGNSILETPDGLLVGGSRDFGSASDGWLLKVDGGGALTYSRTYGGSGEDIFNRLLKTPDGGTLIAGTTASFGASSALFLTHVLQSGAISYSNANAFQHNDEAQKNTLPGTLQTLAPVVTDLALSTADDALDGWTGAPVTAPRQLLAE
ncbi:MAG: repeat protein [Labilithrix sp.]|nr:repeat protein [Labilithrix sp.]